VGRGGQKLTVLMFRTMVADAEARNGRTGGEQRERRDAVQDTGGSRGSPGVWRWLRRYSLDKLPQLINMLHGDMSLVGPRPTLSEEVAQYGGGMYRWLVVKPELTGPLACERPLGPVVGEVGEARPASGRQLGPRPRPANHVADLVCSIRG